MTSNPISRPAPAEYAPFFADYVARVPETDILAALASQVDVVRAAFGHFPEARGGHRYALGKWSVKEMLGHLADAERVFAYRALWFARGDRTPLPGFDENDWVRGADFDACRLAHLLDEWEHLRRAGVLLFRQLPPAAWTLQGVANDNPITVRALAWILVGHARHHLEVLGERYA